MGETAMNTGGTRVESRSQRKEPLVRATHVIIAAVAVTLIGFGVKLIFFTEPAAEAKVLSLKSMGMNISELHRNTKNLPVQTIYDMTFVFSDGD